MKYVQLKQAIVRKLNEDLEAACKSKLEAEQAMRDEFWEKRDRENMTRATEVLI